MEDAYTRTISEDEDNNLTRLLIQMVDNDVLQTDIKTIELTSGQTTATADYELYASHRYTFLLWADDGSYNATDLTAITLKDNLSGTQAGLSYATTATWDRTSANIPVTLNHVASKVTLKTTTDTWAGNTLTLTVPQPCTGYNVQTGTATSTDTTKEYEHSIITTDITASETSPVELFSFYALAADEEQNLTLSCNGKSITVPVNLSGGKHITLTGDVGGMTEEIPTSSTLDVSFGAWDNVTIELDNILTDATVASTSLQGEGTEDDPYLIQSAADLLYYAQDFWKYADDDTHVQLCTDIDITTNNWEPIKVVKGTFDGNGHTIGGSWEKTVGDDGDNYFALFIQVHGKVCDLNVSTDITVSGESTALGLSAGGIAIDVMGGTVTGCAYSGTLTVKATLTGENSYMFIGGISRSISGDATISGCAFSGEIDATEATADTKYIGGIVGEHRGGTLTGNDCSQGNPSNPVGYEL